MGFNTASPWLLPILLLLPLYVWLQYRYTTRITGSKKHIAISLRTLILLLIFIMVIGLTPYTMVEQRNVLVLVDRSDSVGHTDEVINYLKPLDSKDDKDHMAVMSFANNIMMDRALQPIKQQESLHSFRTIVDPSQTNIAAALRQAGGILNQVGGGKIVLFSDGLETIGSLTKEAQLMDAMNIVVDVVPLSSKVGEDAAISTLHVPSQLKQGEKYQLNVKIDSTNEAPAELLIYENDELIAEQMIQLIKGTNTYLIDALATSSGIRSYRAVLRMAEDTQAKNNTAYALSRVSGPAGVLIVEGEQGSSRNIEAALSASYIAYETIQPEQLSYELAQYVQYDSIIFNNVSAVQLPQLKMEHIESAVRNYSVGFVMIGGDNSFGIGGYFDTPIESILPVNMQLSGKKKIPDLSLMLVIDHSGSMSGSKMELAKEAAARTVELMREVDTVGVIAFDSRPTWIVQPTKLQNGDDVISSIMSIQPAGGTDIYPALNDAFDGFDLDAAGRRHIILLTDGISPYTPEYETLLADIKKNGITLSTVAVGQDSDVNFLARLAELGSGRSYYTEDETTLPAIFSREATMMSRAYIVDERVLPIEGYAGTWTNLWSGGLPHIDAYVATSPKTTAEIALWTPQEDPLLARWNIGSGKSVAFTSDLNGRWSSDWVTWSEFPNIFVEWVKWTYPQFSQSPYELKLSEQGSVIVTSNDEASYSNLGMSIQQEDSTSILPLVPLGNGRYEADVSKLTSGIYLSQIGETKPTNSGEQAELENAVTTGFVVPYSAEYRLDANRAEAREKLEALAQLTGGHVRTLEEAESLFQFDPVTLKQSYDWSRELLLLLIILWLADIANRRLALPWGRWLAKLRTATSMSNGHKQQRTSVEQSTFQRLNERKQQLAERGNTLLTKEEQWGEAAQQPVDRQNDQKLQVSQGLENHQKEEPHSTEKNETMNRLLAAKIRRKQ
ncbi:VWA domain-containing protein [Paenibacillus camelliae]|uniref:VWA domain-containing protein n=1 Tax=Paenibacillus camelliae TaxID=512410 RepID=UPI00203F242D|nr:VWA domain-containing protein [Paenibacillus camelliae]